LGAGKPDPSSWDPGCKAASILGQVLGTLDNSQADLELSRTIVAALLEVLESGHPARRFAAIHALKDGRLITAKTAAIPSLIRIMKNSESIDDPYENGPAAAMALSFITDRTESATEVIEIFTRSITARSKSGSWAIDALQSFGPRAESAIPALIGVLKQSENEKRPFYSGAAAARTLGEIAPGTPSGEIVVRALGNSVESRWKETRLAAILALARFGPSAAQAIPQIRVRQETDPDPEVRRTAGGALKRIEGPGRPPQDQTSDRKS
jgi:HEAT repeat protein